MSKSSSFFPFSLPLPLPLPVLDLINPLPALIQARGAALSCHAINHLLKLEPTIQDHLKPHAGRTILLRWEMLGLAPAGEQAVRINADLSISPAVINNPTLADVTVAIQSGIVHAPSEERLRFIRLEGDVFLAQDLSRVAKELRWDAEHDLARVLGDAPAHWVVSRAKRLLPLLQELASRLKEPAQAIVARASQGLHP